MKFTVTSRADTIYERTHTKTVKFEKTTIKNMYVLVIHYLFTFIPFYWYIMVVLSKEYRDVSKSSDDSINVFDDVMKYFLKLRFPRKMCVILKIQLQKFYL